MPVRLRITFLFSILVFIILGFVCAGIYYFFLHCQVEYDQDKVDEQGHYDSTFVKSAWNI